MTNNRLRRLLKLLDIDKVIAIQPYYAKKKEAQEVRTQIGPAKIALDEADLECRKLSTIISEAEVDAVLNSAIPGSPKALSGEITKNAWKAMHKAYQNKVNRKAEFNRLINKYQRLVLEQSALLEPHRKTLMHVNYYEFFKLSETLVNEVERRTFMITELHRQYDVERMHLKEAFAIAQSKP